MPDVDIGWMRQKLEAFLALCEENQAMRKADTFGSPKADTKPIRDQIDDALPTVEQIIRELDPKLLVDAFGVDRYPDGYSATSRQTRRAIAVLRDHEEWKTKLAPDAPSLIANQLHPIVWNAAATVWETGEYKLAAQQACVSLSAQIKAKAGSHLNEGKLVAQVFSPDLPASGQRMLHFPGDPSDETWMSRQRGLHLLAQGAFAGIRNIAVHDDVAWTEHEALEHIAVLSAVARWVDQTQFVAP